MVWGLGKATVCSVMSQNICRQGQKQWQAVISNNLMSQKAIIFLAIYFTLLLECSHLLTHDHFIESWEMPWSGWHISHYGFCKLALLQNPLPVMWSLSNIIQTAKSGDLSKPGGHNSPLSFHHRPWLCAWGRQSVDESRNSGSPRRSRQPLAVVNTYNYAPAQTLTAAGVTALKVPELMGQLIWARLEGTPYTRHTETGCLVYGTPPPSPNETWLLLCNMESVLYGSEC